MSLAVYHRYKYLFPIISPLTYTSHMANLSNDDVRHIAKLARLNIRDEELGKFSKELSAILAYVDLLQEVDTSNVEPTAQVTGLTNSFRDDVVKENITSPEELLQCSPLPIIESQIQTPSAHTHLTTGA